MPRSRCSGSMMNLGIGLGALVGGLIATTSRPATFDVLFARRRGDLRRLPRGAPARRPRADAAGVACARRAGGSYAAVVRDRAFMGVVGAQRPLHLRRDGRLRAPAGLREERGRRDRDDDRRSIFFVNTVVIVLAQLPVAKLSEGHRRMRRWRCSVCSGRAAGCSSRSPACWVTGVAAAVVLPRSWRRSGSASASTARSRRRSSRISPSRAARAATWRSRRSPGRSGSRSGLRSAASRSRRARRRLARAAALCLVAARRPRSCSSGRSRRRARTRPASASRRRSPRRHRE